VIIINRPKNIGMQRNVLSSSKLSSAPYFMWLTDDDFLLDGALKYILDSIEKNPTIGYFWGGLPTFDANTGNYFTLASKTFDLDTLLPQGRESAARFSGVGWALTRQVYCRKFVDFSLAERTENAYFSIMLAAQQMIAAPSLYLSKPYVGHAYLNKEHWDEWGTDVLLRKMKIFCDSLKAAEEVIRPDPSEAVIIEHLSQYRKECFVGYFNSSNWGDFVNNMGLMEATRHINQNLFGYDRIMQELIEFSISRR
jgi:hypothetical protein